MNFKEFYEVRKGIFIETEILVKSNRSRLTFRGVCNASLRLFSSRVRVMRDDDDDDDDCECYREAVRAQAGPLSPPRRSSLSVRVEECEVSVKKGVLSRREYNETNRRP